MGNEKRTCYVGNVPYSINESDLLTFFSPLVPKRITIVKDRDTGRAKGFCFVEFESESDADEAVANNDGQELGGRTLKVSIARERENRGGGGGGDGGGGQRDQGQRNQRNNAHDNDAEYQQAWRDKS